MCPLGWAALRPCGVLGRWGGALHCHSALWWHQQLKPQFLHGIRPYGDYQKELQEKRLADTGAQPRAAAALRREMRLVWGSGCSVWRPRRSATR